MPAKEVRLPCLEMPACPCICSLPGTPTPFRPGVRRAAAHRDPPPMDGPPGLVRPQRKRIPSPRRHPGAIGLPGNARLPLYLLTSRHPNPIPSRSTARSRPSRSSANGWTTRAGTTAKKTNSVASSTSRCDWPAWKCPPAPVSAHFQAPQPLPLQFIAAMGPPGGGRTRITQRYVRHFNLINFVNFSDDSLARVFGTILDWRLSQVPLARLEMRS